MKLQSEFALLDVKRGRKTLAKMMPNDGTYLPMDQRIPIVIVGFISHQHSCDDGTSIEFGVEVTSVEIGKK